MTEKISILRRFVAFFIIIIMGALLLVSAHIAAFNDKYRHWWYRAMDHEMRMFTNNPKQY